MLYKSVKVKKQNKRGKCSNFVHKILKGKLKEVKKLKDTEIKLQKEAIF